MSCNYVTAMELFTVIYQYKDEQKQIQTERKGSMLIEQYDYIILQKGFRHKTEPHDKKYVTRLDVLLC